MSGGTGVTGGAGAILRAGHKHFMLSILSLQPLRRHDWVDSARANSPGQRKGIRPKTTVIVAAQLRSSRFAFRNRGALHIIMGTSQEWLRGEAVAGRKPVFHATGHQGPE